MPENILKFEKALPLSADEQIFQPVSLTLNAGEILLVDLTPGEAELPLVDTALGLTPLTQGSVTFLQADWTKTSLRTTLAMRAQTGRVFKKTVWVSNLDVIENITLSQRHHTKRSLAEIENEAQTWAQKFGLSRVPAGRPATVPERDLRRAEWVRAFMGKPRLICLEEPCLGVSREHLPLLVDACLAAMAKKTAVICLTADHDLRDALRLDKKNNLHYYTVRNNSLAPF